MFIPEVACVEEGLESIGEREWSACCKHIKDNE